MRLINTVGGIVGIQVSPDEVMPEGGLLIEDILKFVGNTYSFATRPEIPHGVSAAQLQPFMFQGGVVEIDKVRVPIFQLVVLQDGDIITAGTTELADKIADGYISDLDSSLGYRHHSAKYMKRYHVSHLVFEFDKPLDEKLAAIQKLQKVLLKEIGGDGDQRFGFRRLSFGGPGAPPQTMPLGIEAIKNADFMIERRQVGPEIPHRYYSVAPTTTTNHIRVLEMIERELS